MVDIRDIKRRFKSASIEDRVAWKPSVNAADKLKDKLWVNFTVELCNLDLAFNQMHHRLPEDGDLLSDAQRDGFQKQTDYFSSTVNRLMFRRLMVRAGLTGKAVFAADVASVLNITSKAAMTMITECIGMGLVERVQTFATGLDAPKHRYTGTDELCYCFTQTAAVDSYRLGEAVVRAWDLYTEMANLIDRAEGTWGEC